MLLSACLLFNTLNYFAVIQSILMLLLPRLSQVNSNRLVDICSELKFYFLLDCWDVWELGLKLVFRGLDPPLVFLTCVFSLAL